ncbi:ATP-dependent helicase [Euzebyella marina]|uniref:DNA 3'-5' helicase n=1 Tax=Euzebyella marina TaxID=1761453 RepID=A0A3G2L146_9FLAO|nr:UvrD-helicase domain-containing protein [Euzebyella marina]AYN65974.1 ATP-dependent helicase [Euzebyella marina]
MHDNSYKIYNASAGSGKTFTLAKEYLKIVLGAKGGFRRILAITFTNKAVNEMKTRILDSLQSFSENSTSDDSSALFKEVRASLNINEQELRERAKTTLKSILHNYAFFDISTIDKFTHRIIRTFAKDLGIPQNFEVVLEIDLLLDEAVSRLLQKAGVDKKLTQVLLDFALEKIDDDKSWDIGQDLYKMGMLMFNENHASHLEGLRNKNIDDFLKLKSILWAEQQRIGDLLVSIANEILTRIEENQLEFSDFTRGYFPKFISDIAQGNLNINFDAGWKQNFETTVLYNKSASDNVKQTLDALHPHLTVLFSAIKQNFYRQQFLKNAYGNLVPLTVLNALRNEVKQIQKERDLLLISEFNMLISKEIKNQPAPFIYERLGEKYRHYFIDEFQDTSQAQWNNLIPLIGNALESQDYKGQTGSLFLVGDAKQAIYRWRGGRAEQFLNLVGLRQNPFVVPPETFNLPVNYRSHEEVINFNNSFFTSTSPLLNNTVFKTLFVEGNKQLTNTKTGGVVQLTFLEKDDENDISSLYCDETLNKIIAIVSSGHAYHDICILVRSNKDGVLLAEFLTEKQIPTISSESLLLSSSDKVRFLVNLLQFAIHSENKGTAFEILDFLAPSDKNKHRFIYENLESVNDLLKERYDFDLDKLTRISVYDGIEWAVRQFSLIEGSDAYLSFFLEEIFDIENSDGPGVYTFLENWEKRKDRLSVTMSQNINAVQIMTVHKSKGLEFPFVIFPFANENIYKRVGGKKMWLPLPSESFNGFKEVLVNEKKELINYSSEAEKLFLEEEHMMELDSFNVLYVALTRAIKGLFVITEKDLTSSGDHKAEFYSGLFIHFLKEREIWANELNEYTFGQLERVDPKEVPQLSKQDEVLFTYTSKEREAFKILTQSGALWDTEREEAIERGNRLHHILGFIDTKEDIHSAIEQSVVRGIIAIDEKNLFIDDLNRILNHSEIAPYFTHDCVIKNEQDVVTPSGAILRPDRIVIKNNTATIIDYKTGKRNPRYVEQLYKYSDAIESMGYEISKRLLIYINDSITLESV